MIHKASKHLRNKRWKPIPGRQYEQGFVHVHTWAGLRSLPAACPVTLPAGCLVEAVGAEAAGRGLVVGMAVLG